VKITWDDAQECIQKSLDHTSGTVSGAAFERHGEISALTRGKLSFLISISTTYLGRSNHAVAPSECPLSSNDTPQSYTERILSNPFTPSPKFQIPLSGSHSQIPCNGCQKAGEIVCPACNGNGRTNCDSCSGEGWKEIGYRCECVDADGRPDDQCRVCDGVGEVLREEKCRTCNGTGFTECGRCDSHGLIDCDSCEGTGFRHQYETRDFRAQRTIDASGIPESWETDYRKFGAEFSWRKDQLHVEDSTDQDIVIQTEPFESAFVEVAYGDDTYRAAVVSDVDGRTVVWDPATSYPSTSVRRKLSDLKSRLLW
jgi:hypothetical protein